MGRRPKARGRDVHGIVLLDKPQGLSSNQALQKVKRLFNANRAGHTGTLDPMATGLLPICLGEATKVSTYLTDADKAYTARMQLGSNTTTGDKEGDVIAEREIPAGWQTRLQQCITDFVGEQTQVPPMYSALKVNGQPLYKLAREGVEVERKQRQVTIYQLELRELGDNWADFYVRCSKGTYVRTLAEDIGEVLGCGAHLTQLRRCEVSPYDSSKVMTLDQLEALAEKGIDMLDQQLAPSDTALSHWPKVELDDKQAEDIKQGRALSAPNLEQGWYRLMYQGELLALAEKGDRGLRSKRLLFIV